MTFPEQLLALIVVGITLRGFHWLSIQLYINKCERTAAAADRRRKARAVQLAVRDAVQELRGQR